MEKQTAVEWVKSEMLEPDLNMKEILKQLKEIEKEITTELFEINKMENRIKVNGEWYVKESTTEIHPIEIELTHFEGCVYENDRYCFEVTRLYRDYDKNEFYSDGIDVKFTDKRTHPWKIDNWDNTTWLRGIFDNDRASIDEALEVMDIDGVKELKALVLELIEKGWIKYYNCENINIGKIRPETHHGMSDLGFGKI